MKLPKRHNVNVLKQLLALKDKSMQWAQMSDELKNKLISAKDVG